MELYKNKEWLENQYKSLSMEEIGKLCNVSGTNIRYFLQKFKIPVKDKREYYDGMTWQERRQKYRIETKKKAVNFLGGKCSKCGYQKCLDALEFHHLDPSQKDFHPTVLIANNWQVHKWPIIEKEISKCVLLCANCHRENHSE